MKICCFIDSLGSGGAQRQIVNLCVGLKNRGHEVSLLTYHPEDFFKKRLSDNNIEVTTITSKGTLGLVIKVRKYFMKKEPDVVVSFLTSPSLIACLASALPHKWKLITGERNSKEEIFAGIKGKITVYAERFSDWKVANSDVGRQMWIKHCPQYTAKLSTIYNPVIIHDTLMSPQREKDGRLRIVVAASYQYTKNPVTVAQALALLSEEERSKIVLEWFGRIEVVSGDTRAYDETKKAVEEKELQNVFVLHGETKEIYTEMNNADVVGLFSIVEGLPNAICEGMMLGKPIIMTPVSDFKTFVTPENGFLCADPGVGSILNALRLLINSSDETIKNMGIKSKEIADRLFDFRSNIDKWESLIFDLVM